MIVSEPRPVLPHLSGSTNNLDLARHDGRLWLAVRNAPSHFASAEARLLVWASDDEGRTWRLDHEIAAGRDVREPRLVSWRGRLLLAWFTAGTARARFEPDRVWVAERTEHGWTEGVPVSPPDCVVWRIRPVGDRLLMTVYRGAGALFTAHPEPLTVELWASGDGFTWEPADPTHPVVHHGGAEAEILPLPDGRLLVVVRKEGPDGGWGSDIGVAPADDPTRWVLRPDPRKMDSPLLFLDGGTPYLVARRQVAFGGRYDLGLTGLAPALRTRVDQVAYSLTPKRTGVFRVDPDALTATWVGDLPSAGDTAFAGVVAHAEDPRRHLVVNYSSPLHHRRWPWLLGQMRPTGLYAVELSDLDGAAP